MLTSCLYNIKCFCFSNPSSPSSPSSPSHQQCQPINPYHCSAFLFSDADDDDENVIAIMDANDQYDYDRLRDESMVHMVDMVHHEDKEDCWHNQDQMNQNLVVEVLDYSHLILDFVSSILFDGFETKCN